LAYRSSNTPDSRNRLSDRDMLLDILATTKSMSSLYDHAILEANDSIVRETFENLQQDEHHSAEMIYNIMQEQGMYNTGSRQAFGQRYRKSQNSDNRYNTQNSTRYSQTSGRSQLSRKLSGSTTTTPASRNREMSSQTSWNI
jgi:hypothetical protein